PDLTRNDKSKQQPSGGPITLDITSVEYYDTVFSFTESPVQKDLLWAGTDDGLVQLSRDGGKSWTNVTPKEMPEWGTVSQIDACACPTEAGTAWVAVDRHRLDDVRPYIFKTGDYGKTWTSLTNGIPNGAFVRAVRQDPKQKNVIYAATETGVYISFDGAQHWQSLQLNLPATPVTDLIIKDGDVAISTNGRGFWVLDSIAPLREVSASTANGDMHLFTPSATVRFRYPESLEQHRPVGYSPMGTYIDYWFKTAPAGEVTLDIKDSKGNLVRSFSSQKKKTAFEQPPEWPDLVKPVELIPAEAGMNRFAWNQRYESPVETPDLFYAGNGPEGPIVLPGTYHLTLTANGRSESADLVVLPDPRVKISNADMQAAFDLQMKVRDDFTTLHNTLNQMRTLKSNLEDAKRKVGEKSPVIATIDKFESDMAPIEAQLTQVKLKSSEGTLRYPVMLNEQYDTFRAMIENADAAPTQPMLDVYADLHKRLETAASQWNNLLASEGRALTTTNVPLVVIK
ncbi:MAG TPA: glycosyl hydrolase, partial [Thermoanaerobaculia bacterium]|nr:glycosyl hydrolase [Thermoanaerobaculia bacterium]